MKVPYSWLKEFIDLNVTPEEVAKTLTLAGMEVDAIEKVGSSFSGVVVGEVLDVEKHPNADKLVVAKVSNGIETFQVVCGAPNCRPGIKTALAMVGATLDDENGGTFKIRQSKLRGVESFGMLCSFEELKLGNESDGIIEFESHIPVGQDVSTLYADAIFEISLTPNLGHCSSVLGIARELAAAYDLPVKKALVEIYEDDFSKLEDLVKVEVEDYETCLRYSCRLIKDVTITESPKWLQDRLNQVGIRPINNVVDVTNYVMTALGQPMHAFDFSKIEDATIRVRKVFDGESFITLDEKPRILSKDDLLIADGKKAIAIAGVMGGLDSGIQANTKEILLESACFLPTSIRKTSKRLQLQTDSSKRFERGTDPNMTLYAIQLASQLIEKVANGKVVQGTIDLKRETFKEKTISCRLNRINQLLGTELGVSEVESIFKKLEMSSKVDGKLCFSVTVPTYRNDLQEEIDLVEEVARIYGYDNIPKATPKYSASNLNHSPIYLFEGEVRSKLIAEGLQEFLTCDLIGPSLLNVVNGPNMDENSVVKVLNPTSIEQSVLRTSLLPGLLQAIKYNKDHQNSDVSAFEIGRIHFKNEDKYKEHSVVGIILTGKKNPKHWSSKEESVDFYDLKGIVENMLQDIGIDHYEFRENQIDIFHDSRQAMIFVNDLEVGSIGEIHPSVQRKLDHPERILFAEISLHDLYPLRKNEVRMSPLPLYPNSTRDWTITLKEEVSYEEILKCIRSTPSELLEEVLMMDIYRSDKLGRGLKNVTLRFTYRDREKTVSQESVDREHANITNEILKSIKN